MNITVSIYKSVDAFLYLPVYIAKELGIFDTVLKKHKLDNVKIEFPESELNGTDIKAIENMLDLNCSNKNNEFAICVSDPMAFLTGRFDAGKYDINDCVVIGSLIYKLPFWAVNHKRTKCKNIEDLRNSYSKIIHYNEDLVTGYALGQRIIDQKNSIKGVSVNFDQAIAECEKLNTSNYSSVAITADIVSLVKSAYRENNPLRINYKFSNIEYLSTGIITSRSVTENRVYHQILCDIIEGIQKSILIVYSSEIISKTVSSQIAEIINSKLEDKLDITSNDIDRILELIQDEKFYPADLNVSKEIWNETISELSKRIDLNASVNIDETYEKFVDNQFVMCSEKSLAKQLGIDLNTFEKEVNAIIEPIKIEKDRFQSELSKIGKRTYKFGVLLTNLLRYLSKYIFKIMFVISVLVVLFVCLYFAYYYYENKKLADFSGSVITSLISSGIIFLLTLVRNKKNEIK